MKVSKKRLIEIITEEISRVRKEAARRPRTGDRGGTIGGGGHRKMDPQERPTRGDYERPTPIKHKKKKQAYELGHKHGVGKKTGGDDWREPVGVQDRRSPIYHLARGKQTSFWYTQGRSDGFFGHRDSTHPDSPWNEDETMQESFRFMSKNQIQAQINQAEADGIDDGSLLAYYPEDMTANEAEKFMYGNSPDPKYWGDAIRVHPDAAKAYWARRKEVYDHLKAKQ